MADNTNASRGSVAGTVNTAEADENRVASVATDDRGRLVRAVDRHLLADVVGGRADEAGGDTRISGSDDRSMCFLSSVASQAIDL
jgi:hypothetical protein